MTALTNVIKITNELEQVIPLGNESEDSIRLVNDAPCPWGDIAMEEYEGDYIVTPKVESQTMPTKNKLLTEDVTIKSIPFYNVSNTSGGSTVFIGNEV